jgi:hypothetical protein
VQVITELTGWEKVAEIEEAAGGAPGPLAGASSGATNKVSPEPVNTMAE